MDGQMVLQLPLLMVAMKALDLMRVARYAPDGTFTSSLSLPATQVSCPAFGGSDLTTLFVTTAYENLAEPSKFDGQTFFDDVDVVGQKEHQVKL